MLTGGTGKSRIFHFLASVAAIFGFAGTAVAQVEEPSWLKPNPNSLIGKDRPDGMSEEEQVRRIAHEIGFDDVDDFYGITDSFTEFGNKVIIPNIFGRGGLDFHDRELIVIATILAQSHPHGLIYHYRRLAPQAGITERELEELIFTACAYNGMPRCAAANIELRKVMNGPNDWPARLRKSAALHHSSSEDTGSLVAVDRPAGIDDEDYLHRLAKEVGLNTVRYGTNEDFHAVVSEHMLPLVYGRGGMSFHDRELIVIASIIAQSIPEGLSWHFSEVAIKAGISEREIRETIYITCLYGGWAKCAAADRQLQKVLEGPNNWPQTLRMPEETPSEDPVDPLPGFEGTSPQFQAFTRSVVAKALGNRPGLTLQERELVVMAILMGQSMPDVLNQRLHHANADLGLSEEALQELVFTACLYGGWPKCAMTNIELGKVIEARKRASGDMSDADDKN